MKRVFLLAVSLIVFPLLSVSAQLLDSTIATVNLISPVPITQRMVRPEVERREQQIGRKMTVDERRAVLQEFIDDELLSQAAERDGFVASNDEIDQAISRERVALGPSVTEAQFRTLVEQQSGLSWDGYRNEIKKRLGHEQLVVSQSQDVFSSIPDPTATDIRRFYEENATEFVRPSMVRFDHLFFDTRGLPANEQTEVRRRASTIASDLRTGRATFDAALAQTLDDVTVSGGDFGYLILTDPAARNQLGDGFVETVFFDLEPGEVSGVISSTVGYHIVRVRDRRAPKLLELSDAVMPGESVTVQQEIVNALTNQAQQRAFQRGAQRILTDLRSSAEVTVQARALNWQ